MYVLNLKKNITLIISTFYLEILSKYQNIYYKICNCNE